MPVTESGFVPDPPVPTAVPDLGPDRYEVYGPLVARGNVESAALATLSQPPEGGFQPLIVYYLAAVERANGLPPKTLRVPPGERSYLGGIDFETYGGDQLPTLIAVAQPVNAPERDGGGEYGQWFELQVAAVVSAESEDDARSLADSYGIAATALILQHGALGGLAVKTNLNDFPRTEFVDPDDRRLMRSVAGFHVLVQPVVTERYRPLSFGPDPYADPGYCPEVETVTTTFKGLPAQ
jgi:hypothetical protein